MSRRPLSRTTFRAALALLAAAAPPLAAQEVVQPLPPPGSEKLNSALQRLGRDSGDVDALLDAGEAALQLGDIPAAIGFFGRAQDISAGNGRVALGLARAYTLSRRPVEALRLFAEAERAGVAPAVMAADRALAFDLVGDTASAQNLYRLALAQEENSETRRNLALSQAISGDKAGFEATLLPLLQQGDNSAFRTRAFGLAVLGEIEAAVKIARDMMSAQAAARVEPYLRYMPRLTPAQQAAAGTLGVFPRSASIGRDDPAIAAYERGAVRTADAGLVPQGEPLGPRRGQRAAGTTPSAGGAAPVARSEPAPASARQSDPEVSVADAFADFDLAEAASSPRAGAVDITRIEVPREVAPPPAPAPPKHPARHWVQVATGKDRSALAFDWRRISRKANGALGGKGPFTTPWGEANRLLAGPYESRDAARAMIGRLRELEIDSFPFSSDEGQEIAPLD